jgi:hypothetical protein
MMVSDKGVDMVKGTGRGWEQAGEEGEVARNLPMLPGIIYLHLSIQNIAPSNFRQPRFKQHNLQT